MVFLITVIRLFLWNRRGHRIFFPRNVRNGTSSSYVLITLSGHQRNRNSDSFHNGRRSTLESAVSK